VLSDKIGCRATTSEVVLDWASPMMYLSEKKENVRVGGEFVHGTQYAMLGKDLEMKGTGYIRRRDNCAV
jgi:hypothetical protein